MPNNQELRKRLEAIHPELMSVLPEIRFFKETFLGGKTYFSNNLFSHRREDESDFEDRRKRAYYLNICAPVVSIFNGYMGTAEKKRKIGFDSSPDWAAFMSDCTGDGTTFEDLLSEARLWALVQEKSYVLLDRPRGEATTKAEEKEKNLNTFAKRLDREDVLDWKIGPDGLYDWVKIRGKTIDKRMSFDSKHESMDEIIVWSREEITVYQVSKDSVEVVYQAPNKIKVVPLVEFSRKDGSLIKDAAYVNRSVFNHCSLLDEILYRQTFAQLILPDYGDIDGAKLGTSSAITVDPDIASKPFYLAPPSGPAEVLMSQIKSGCDIIRWLILYKSDSEAAAAASGVAKAYDFAQLDKTLVATGKEFESSEELLAYYWGVWAGVPENQLKEIIVTYPDSYDISDLENLVEDTIKIQSIGIGKIFDKYLKKRVARSVVDPRETEEIKEIIAEIDAMTEGKLPPTTEEAEKFSMSEG